MELANKINFQRASRTIHNTQLFILFTDSKILVAMEHLICHHYKGETIDNYARIYILFTLPLLQEDIGTQAPTNHISQVTPKIGSNNRKAIFFQMLMQYTVILF